MPVPRLRLKSCIQRACAQILDSMSVIRLLFLCQRANALTDIKDPRADRSQGNSTRDGARGFIRRVAASCAASEKQVPRLRIAIDEANRNAPLGMTRVLLSVFSEAHLIPKSVNTLGFSSPEARSW